MQSNHYPLTEFTADSSWVTKETPNDVVFLLLSFIPINALRLNESLNFAIFLVNKDLYSRKQAFVNASNPPPLEANKPAHEKTIIDYIMPRLKLTSKYKRRSNVLLNFNIRDFILGLDKPASVENKLEKTEQLKQLVHLDNLTKFKEADRIYISSALDEFILIAKKSPQKTAWLNYFFEAATLDYVQKNLSLSDYVQLAIDCEQTLKVICAIFEKHASPNEDWLELLNELIDYDIYRPDITHFIFKNYFPRFEEKFKTTFWETLSLTIYTGDFELFQSLCEKIPRLLRLDEDTQKKASGVIYKMIDHHARGNSLHSWLYTLLQKLPAPVFTATDPILTKLFIFTRIHLDLNVVKLLVKYGANVNAPASNRNDAPLRMLVKKAGLLLEKDFLTAFKFLIENGANFNCVSDITKNIVYHGLNERNFELIRFLLEEQLIQNDFLNISFDISQTDDFLLHAIQSGWVDSTYFVLKHNNDVCFPHEIKFDIATVRATVQLEKIVTFKNHLNNLYLITKNQYCTLMMLILKKACFALQDQGKLAEAADLKHLIDLIRENHKEKSVEKIVEEWKLSSSIFKQTTSSKNSSKLVSFFTQLTLKEKTDPLMQLINELVEQSKHYIKPPSMFLPAPTTTAGTNDPNVVSTQKNSI